MPNSPMIKCEGISQWFGDNKVLHNINLDIPAGSIVSVVGPSGCGKSTLLRAIVGTHPAKKGNVLVRDEDDSYHTVKTTGRDRGIVYQEYTLSSHLTALQNVALGPKVDQTTIPGRLFRPLKWRKLRKQHLDQAREMLDVVSLSHAYDLYPKEMSGGMRQRVAIAQALVMKPKILLLDEPFGALDEATRESLQKLLLKFSQINREARSRGETPPYTIFLVTHELNEAIYVGDFVIGLSQYWDWKKEGFDECPGATIIYNKPAPIFDPTDDKENAQFAAQREEIKRIVLEPTHEVSHDFADLNNPTT